MLTAQTETLVLAQHKKKETGIILDRAPIPRLQLGPTPASKTPTPPTNPAQTLFPHCAQKGVVTDAPQVPQYLPPMAAAACFGGVGAGAWYGGAAAAAAW